MKGGRDHLDEGVSERTSERVIASNKSGGFSTLLSSPSSPLLSGLSPLPTPFLLCRNVRTRVHGRGENELEVEVTITDY